MLGATATIFRMENLSKTLTMAASVELRCGCPTTKSKDEWLR